MFYKTSDIVADVRVALDLGGRRGDAGGGGQTRMIHYTPTGDDEGGLSLPSLSLEVDAVIRSKIPDAVRQVHLSAPLHMVDTGRNLGVDMCWDDGEGMEGVGWTVLPHDFLRLVSLRMASWRRAVHGVITPESELYARQRSRHAGVRGNAERPVVALVPRSVGQVLEIYSAERAGEACVEGAYIAEPLTEREAEVAGGHYISRDCYRAVVLLTAALTASALGDKEQWGRLMRELGVRSEEC